jgi:hypothetical protein
MKNEDISMNNLSTPPPPKLCVTVGYITFNIFFTKKKTVLKIPKWHSCPLLHAAAQIY